MTIEQLLGCNAEQLEAMSDEDLRKYFEPYLKWTHVEKIEKVIKKPSAMGDKLKKKRLDDRVQQILALYGKDKDIS